MISTRRDNKSKAYTTIRILYILILKLIRLHKKNLAVYKSWLVQKRKVQ